MLRVKVLTFILLFTLFLSLININIVTAEAPSFSVINVFWGVGSYRVEAKPGDKNVPLTINIHNTDVVDMRSVTVTLKLHSTPFSSLGGKEAVSGCPVIYAGQTATLTFNLDIDENAKLGTYIVEMEVKSVTQRYLTGVTSTTQVLIPLYGEVSFSSFLSPKTIHPGYNNITLTLKNDGKATAKNVNVYVFSSSLAVVIGEDNQWFFPKILPSEEVEINFEVYASIVQTGVAVPFSIMVSYDDGYGFPRNVTRYVGLTVEPPSVKPILDIKIDSEELVAGVVNNLTVYIKNKGTSTAKNLEVSLSLPRHGATMTTMDATSPLILVGEDNLWFFELLRPNSTVTFPVSILAGKNVVGTYTVTFTLSYRDQYGNLNVETREVGLNVEPKPPSSFVNIQAYKLEPGNVCVGEAFNLTLKIKNFGNFKAQMVVVQLLTPSFFATLSPSTVNLGDLTPGAEKNVTFFVMASPKATVGVVYSMEVDISYVDSLGVMQLTRNLIGIPLHGKVDLTIYDVITIPSPAPVGKTSTISFTLLNKGLSSAMYTSITIVPEYPFKAVAESSAYLGHIDPNAPLPTSLNVLVEECKDGVYPVKLLISYLDEYSKPHSLTYTILVEVAHVKTLEETGSVRKGFELNFLLVILLPIIVAALIVATLVLRRRKKV
ncbi:MAG: COG1361 S-layer family protein [Candidatus Bathyarchaeota archaeon]